MNLTDFVPLGTTGIAIVVIWFIVQRFLKSSERRDERFIELIKNDMVHTRKTMEDLKDVIKELYFWLKKNNR